MTEGRYFPPGETSWVPARASVLPRRMLHIEDESGAVLAEIAGREVTASARLASLTRRFDLAGAARFESDDDAGADALLWALRKRRRGRFTHGLERAWPVVALALIAALAVGLYLLLQFAPLGAERLARRTLPGTAHIISEQTLRALDHGMLWPSGLVPAEQARAAALFAKVAAKAHGGAGAYRLVLRAGGAMGASAFALPDGTIVVTDQLWAAATSDAEIEGVFAVEMSHADHAHALQRAYAAAPLPAALTVFAGDKAEVSRAGAALPGLIAYDAMPAAFQRKADEDAAATLRRLGGRPSDLAALIERLDAAACGAKGCKPNWAGDHAHVAARVALLRRLDKGKSTEDCLKPWRGGISLHCLGLD